MEKFARIELLGSGEKIKWKQTDDALVIAQPKNRAERFRRRLQNHGQVSRLRGRFAHRWSE